MHKIKNTINVSIFAHTYTMYTVVIKTNMNYKEND